jgi:hypothetical protein
MKFIKQTFVILFSIVATLLLSCGNSVGQKEVNEIADVVIDDTNKRREACISWEVYKGKKNHGQKYCTGWATIENGDTVALSFSGGMAFIGEGYEKYKKLSERGKYIIDSLKEDGIGQLQQLYMTYEPLYMKQGKKTEWFWEIWEQEIIMYQYSFWNNGKGHGYELLKSFAVK